MATSITRRALVATSGTAALGIAAAGTLTAPALAEEAAEAQVAGTPENRWQSQAAADWRMKPEAVAENQIADGGTFDIVVVGGGQSGTWCARFATNEGASVAVLEATEEESFLYIGGEIAVVNSDYCTPISGMSLALCMVEGVLMGTRLAKGDFEAEPSL